MNTNELITELKRTLREYREGCILATQLARYIDNLVSHHERSEPMLGPRKLPWEGNEVIENELGAVPRD